MVCAGENQKSSVDPDRRLHPPWSLSPFVDQAKAVSDDEAEDSTAGNEKETTISPSFANELRVKIAHEVPQVDLILEIAMTTALSNLTNNTSLLRGKDVLGYLCFWGLTWWIWASAVAYNVRFRQADWVHRGAAILQLAVFGALAAFTRNFDITVGLTAGDDADQTRMTQTQINLGAASKEGIMAKLLQQDRLPGLNFRGIAMTMAWSRVLLMTQYIIVYIYALRLRQSPNRFSPALLTHILSLLLSAVAFFISFAVIGHDASREDNIAKIVLWYGAILVELIAHFLPPAFNMKGHVAYEPKELSSRATTLFLVVLGQGLDQLTGTFSFVVGPEGFGKFSIGLLISTAIIFIGQFSLFNFGHNSLQKRCVRRLAWFFGQFIYTSTLIILISATANDLVVSNFLNVVGRAVIAGVDVQQQVTYNLILNSSSGIPVTTLPANFQATENDTATLAKSGIASTDIIKVTFEAYTNPNFTDIVYSGSYNESYINSTIYDYTGATVVQQGLNTFLTVAEQFSLKPEESEPLYWDFQLALSKPNDGSVANFSTFTKLYAGFIREHDDSVTWFPASAGGSLIITALLRYIGQTPHDRWEWIQTLTIGFAGIGYTLLSILDIGSRQPIIFDKPDELDVGFNSAIFKFDDSGWVLPSFAILNLLILIALGVQKYLAQRSREKMRKIELQVAEPLLYFQS